MGGQHFDDNCRYDFDTTGNCRSVICHGYLRFEGEIRFQFQNLQYGMAIWAVSRDMKTFVMMKISVT